MAAPSGATPLLGYRYPTPDDDVNVPRDLQALAEDNEAKNFIIGEIRFVAVLVAPKGFLPCDGAAKSRTTYAKLFAAISTVFGAGDGSTTFNVPDLKGRAPISNGAGAGLTNRTIGSKGGEETHRLAPTEMPYEVSVNLSTTGMGWLYGSQPPPPALDMYHGANNPHNTMMPFIVIPAYIYAGA